jgi:outer membrane protein assembly complex protein YaeT
MLTRFAAAWVAALALLLPADAAADVSDYVGKPIASVALEAGGRPTTDPRVLGLVETHVGELLLIAAVRESITHLFSLGQFEDVRVHAAARGAAVALTYELVPLRTIAGVSFAGERAPGIDQGRLRRLIAERFGTSPPPARAPDIAALVAEDVKEVGYLHARVTARTELDPGGSRSTLVLALASGERTRIGTIEVEGDAGMPIPRLLDALRVQRGAPFERESLNARIDRYLDERRSHGYFAARMSFSPRFVDDDRTANLTFSIVPGPHVTVVFTGDPMPVARRDDLVPVAREGSADEDLLEDASNRIEELLQSQGYRDAKAPHTREERDGELAITFTVHKGPQYRVGRVDFSGNTTIPLTDLQQRLRIRPGQPFSEAAIDADRAILEDFYHRAGFSAVQTVVSTESEPAIAGAVDVPVAIRIAVTENARTLVNSVRIEGNLSVSESSLRDGLTLQAGQPFSANALAVDRDAVQLRLANLGYQSATVATNAGISADGTRADVVLTVREGQRIAVDHVLIVGNERTRTATIERELQFKAGEPLGLEQVNESQRRLAALGLFRRVRITELAHGDETRRDVLVSLEEAPVTTVGYGGGVEAGQLLQTAEENGVASAKLEVAPRAFFEIGRRNLFGKNRSINLFTRVSLGNLQSQTTTRTALGFGEYRAIGTYREPRVFGSGADAFLTGTLEQQRRSSFNFARRAFSAELGRRITRRVSISGNYQIQRTELFDEKIDPEFRIPIDRLFPQVRLSSFSTSVVRDTRDDLTDPADGRFLSANGQLAGRRIGSEVGFAKSYVVAQMFRVLPRTRRMVLATSARLGAASGFPRETIDRDENGDPVLGPDGQPTLVTVRDLPASERFFAGGDTTVRGFALDQLGRPDTIDKDGFPTGGGGLVIVNAELRVPVARGLGAVGFFDAGNVFARTSDIRLTDLRGAIGFGVRYKSPIGPIRVDLGFKLHRNVIAQGARESLTALHISLGQAF